MKTLKYSKIVFLLLVFLLLTSEVEGRRKILRGRKAITRHYMRSSALPSWAVIILVALGEILAGGILYLIMKICILDKAAPPRRYQHVTPPESPAMYNK